MTTDIITLQRIDALHESPFNPRKIFDDAALAELAADIKAQGRVLQPLLVRPRIPPLFAGDPDATAGYEIVFGHRRFRAAELAGLAEVPCMVRTMSDAEARRAQISENLQRTDVHPIEEAEGFKALIDNDGESADTIAEQFGKSRSHVYGRLKLLEACPEIRKACLAGEIGSEVALLVARLRTVKLQEKALGYIRADWRAKLDDGGKASYRAIRDLLTEKFTLDLKEAMFDIHDETLLPIAGNCVTCPKRSSNAPEFTDLAEGITTRHGLERPGRPNACTDPDCFAAKKVAHLKREADKLTAGGKVVIGGNAARNSISARGEVKGAYVPLKSVEAALKSLKPNAARGKSGALPPTKPQPPQVVLIQDPRTGKTHKAVKLADLQAAGVKVADPKARAAGTYEQREARRKENERKEQLKADHENLLRRAVLQRVREHVASSERDAFDLRLVANAAIAGVDYHDRRLLLELWNAPSLQALAETIDTMAVADITRLLMDCGLVRNAMAHHYNLRAQPQVLYAVAEHYDLDVDAIRAEAAATISTPAPAARAPDQAAAGAGAKRAKIKKAPANRAARAPATPTKRLGKPFHPTHGPRPPGAEQTNDAGVAGGSVAAAGAL